MSAALESLMPQTQSPNPAGKRSGIMSFILIGLSGAAAFVLLSNLVLLAFPLAGWGASTFCYGALIVPVYLLHRRFSFRSRIAHTRALPRYMAVQGMALGLASLFGFLLHGALALPSLPASMLVIGLTSGVNFMLLKAWAFARPNVVVAVPA